MRGFQITAWCGACGAKLVDEVLDHNNGTAGSARIITKLIVHRRYCNGPGAMSIDCTDLDVAQLQTQGAIDESAIDR